MKTALRQQAVFISVAAAIALVATSYLAGQAAQPAPAAGAAVGQVAPGAPGARGGARAGGRGPAQWGNGPIKVMVVTHGHGFSPRDDFFGMFDALGADISWRSVEHPAADVLLQPKYSDQFDVYVFYDRGGTGVPIPAPQPGVPALLIPPGAKVENSRYYPQPSAEFRSEFPKLLKQGNKGFVFLHHSNAAWVHVWPEYSEVVGSACDWSAPSTVRGIEHPAMGFYANTPQKIAIVDKTHPMTKDMADFEVNDESYNCVFFEDSVHPIARTDFDASKASFQGGPGRVLNPQVKSSNLAAYVKAAENSPVAYIQMGHGAGSWTNPAYRQLVANAIKWAASPEAKTWAKANRKQIFK